MCLRNVFSSPIPKKCFPFDKRWARPRFPPPERIGRVMTFYRVLSGDSTWCCRSCRTRRAAANALHLIQRFRWSNGLKPKISDLVRSFLLNIRRFLHLHWHTHIPFKTIHTNISIISKDWSNLLNISLYWCLLRRVQFASILIEYILLLIFCSSFDLPTISLFYVLVRGSSIHPHWHTIFSFFWLSLYFPLSFSHLLPVFVRGYWARFALHPHWPFLIYDFPFYQ